MTRILVVDDEQNQLQTLAIGLRSNGFEVSIASTASEALDILAREPADIALIDLMMPELNGLELARQIRTQNPRVRVVLSSAYHLSARQVERADCGAVGFVPKPFALHELCAFLRSKAPVTPAPSC